MRRYGIKPVKRRGQHLVVKPEVLHRLADYAELTPSDTVLEIGTGAGALTAVLAPRVKRVVSVESDRRMLKLAERSVEHSNVEFVHGDILRVELPEFNKVVSNIPYGISSEITFWLLDRDFDLAVITYQREFAERLVALPGSPSYGRVSVNFYYRAQAEILEFLPPEVFFPPPRVWSAVVRIKPRKAPFEVVNWKLFERVVRALFQHRRQKVRNALLHSFHEVFPEQKLHTQKIREIIERAIPPSLFDLRVSNTTPEAIGEITNLLAKALEGFTSP